MLMDSTSPGCSGSDRDVREDAIIRTVSRGYGDRWAVGGHWMATDLVGLTLDELEMMAAGLGEPRYRGRQLARWIYRHQRLRSTITRLTLRMGAASIAILS